LKLLGWKIYGEINHSITKGVMIVAPHTSYMDFIIGKLALNALNVKAYFLIKKEFFFFPIGCLIKALGGIPVDRDKSTNVVLKVSKLFEKNQKLIIVITPEGTRKLTHNWKKGFYYIALNAKVPIIPGYLDYKEKTAGIGEVLIPSGNFNEDFKILEKFYKGRHARFPENYNLS